MVCILPHMLGNRESFSSLDDSNLREGSPFPVESSPEAEEYIPRWKQIQEDLKYMFQIDIEKEEDLGDENIRQKMYEKAVNAIRENSPFTLDYFFEEHLLNKTDIKPEDREELAVHARVIVEAMKDSPRRRHTEQLFVNAGIIREKDIEEFRKAK